jgi:hypothetical protein
MQDSTERGTSKGETLKPSNFPRFLQIETPMQDQTLYARRQTEGRIPRAPYTRPKVVSKMAERGEGTESALKHEEGGAPHMVAPIGRCRGCREHACSSNAFCHKPHRFLQPAFHPLPRFRMQLAAVWSFSTMYFNAAAARCLPRANIPNSAWHPPGRVYVYACVCVCMCVCVRRGERGGGSGR